MSVFLKSSGARPGFVIDGGAYDQPRSNKQIAADHAKTRKTLVQILPYYLEAALGRNAFLDLKVQTRDFDKFINDLAWRMLDYAEEKNMAQYQESAAGQAIQIGFDDFNEREREILAAMLKDIRIVPTSKRPKAGRNAIILLMGRLWKKALQTTHGGPEKYQKLVEDESKNQSTTATGNRG